MIVSRFPAYGIFCGALKRIFKFEISSSRWQVVIGIIFLILSFANILRGLNSDLSFKNYASAEKKWSL